MFGIMITIPILVAVIFTPTSNPWSISMDFSSCRHGNESWTRPALVFWGSILRFNKFLWWEEIWETREKPSGKMTKCSIDGKAIQILVMIIQLLSPYSLGKWCYQSRCKASVWLITLPISCPRCEVQQKLRPNLQICQWLCRYLWAVCCFGAWFLHMLFSIILQLSYSHGVDMATHHVCLVGATCLYILVGCTCESTLVFSLYKDTGDL